MLHEAAKALAGGFSESVNLAISLVGGLYLALRRIVTRGLSNGRDAPT